MQKYHRDIGLNFSGKIDPETKTIVVSFSSELAVPRRLGLEILSHDEEAINLERMQDSAPVLVEHGGDQVGVVQRCWLGDDKRLYAEIRFSSSQRGEEVFKDIQEGIRKNVSFGYDYDREDIEISDDGRSFIVKKWMPYELSIVAIPADPTVGVGRSADTSDQEPVADQEPEPVAEERKYDVEDIAQRCAAIVLETLQQTQEPEATRGLTVSQPEKEPAAELKRGLTASEAEEMRLLARDSWDHELIEIFIHDGRSKQDIEKHFSMSDKKEIRSIAMASGAVLEGELFIKDGKTLEEFRDYVLDLPCHNIAPVAALMSRAAFNREPQKTQSKPMSKDWFQNIGI